jgi:hypothetical protein
LKILQLPSEKDEINRLTESPEDPICTRVQCLQCYIRIQFEANEEAFDEAFEEAFEEAFY